MDTKICVPVMGETKEKLISQVETVIKMNPDLMEVRADYLEDISEKSLLNILKEVKEKAYNTPIIFTFRTKTEGGEKDISYDEYLAFCKVGADICDYIDIEMMHFIDNVKELVQVVHQKGKKVIGSNHHFDKTPSNDDIENIMKSMEKAGADVCKIAVMPNQKKDVERFINISAKLNNEISVPIITMSMGELGAVTRICTNKTGSAVTFAAGVDASAPGQINIEVLRELLKANQHCRLNGNIALIGFMGTGKTTVSKALAEITGLHEIDVDQYIVETQGMTISDIFEKYGEARFREIETEALKTVSKNSGQIISCGGGAVLKDENVDILKENGKIVLLTATPETIFDRVKDHTHRPILNSDMSLKHVKELMAQREPRYQSVADIKVNVDSNDRVLTCYNILKGLKEMGQIE